MLPCQREGRPGAQAGLEMRRALEAALDLDPPGAERRPGRERSVGEEGRDEAWIAGQPKIPFTTPLAV